MPLTREKIAEIMGIDSSSENPFLPTVANSKPAPKQATNAQSNSVALDEETEDEITETRLPFELPPTPTSTTMPPVEINASGRPRRAAAPTIMKAVGDPIRFSRKKSSGSSRSKRKTTVANSDSSSEDEVAKARERLNISKRKRVTRIPKEESEDEEDGIIATPDFVKPSTKKAKGKYASVGKNISRGSVKARSSTSSSDVKKDSKQSSRLTESKRKSTNASRILGRKGKGRAIPTRVQDCDAVDLMVWQWRHAGKSWPEIRQEWTRMTGVTPGRSSLSVRMGKMEDNFLDNGGSDDLLLLKLKDDVETELEDLRWTKVAEKLKADQPDTKQTSKTLKKRYNAIKESGWKIGKAVDEQAPPLSIAAAIARDGGVTRAEPAGDETEHEDIMMAGAGDGTETDAEDGFDDMMGIEDVSD